MSTSYGKMIFGLLLFLCSCNLGDSRTLQELAEEIEFATNLLDSTTTADGTETQVKKRFTSLADVQDVNALLSTGEVPNHYTCPKIPKPANGQLVCGGRLCLVQCDEGYMQDFEHAFVYKCNEDGKWLSIPANKPIPWPACVKETFERFQERLAKMADKKL